MKKSLLLSLSAAALMLPSIAEAGDRVLSSVGQWTLENVVNVGNCSVTSVFEDNTRLGFTSQNNRLSHITIQTAAIAFDTGERIAARISVLPSGNFEVEGEVVSQGVVRLNVSNEASLAASLQRGMILNVNLGSEQVGFSLTGIGDVMKRIQTCRDSDWRAARNVFEFDEDMNEIAFDETDDSSVTDTADSGLGLAINPFPLQPAAANVAAQPEPEPELVEQPVFVVEPPEDANIQEQAIREAEDRAQKEALELARREKEARQEAILAQAKADAETQAASQAAAQAAALAQEKAQAEAKAQEELQARLEAEEKIRELEAARQQAEAKAQEEAEAHVQAEALLEQEKLKASEVVLSSQEQVQEQVAEISDEVQPALPPPETTIRRLHRPKARVGAPQSSSDEASLQNQLIAPPEFVPPSPEEEAMRAESFRAMAERQTQAFDRSMPDESQLTALAYEVREDAVLSQPQARAETAPVVIPRIPEVDLPSRIDLMEAAAGGQAALYDTLDEPPRQVREVSNQELEEQMRLASLRQGGDDYSAEPAISAVPESIENVTAPATENFRWFAQSGDDLRTTIARWTIDEGIDLVWDTQNQFNIPMTVQVNESFESAVVKLLNQYQNNRQSGLRPVGEMFVDPNTGNKVLIIKAVSS